MKLVITKLEAAERQLREAIRLWFTDGDPIAVHSLACSAHQIIHDLNTKHGWRDLIYDSLIIKDEFRDEWAHVIKAPYNFLKHADRNAVGSIELHTEVTDLFILFSLMGLELLGRQHDATAGAYILYVMIHQPEQLTEKGKRALAGQFPLESIHYLTELPKPAFIRAYLAARRAHAFGPALDSAPS